MAVVGLSRLVLVEQPRDGLAAEPAALACEHVACEVTEVLAEPAAERDAEPDLSAALYLRGQIRRERATKRHLALAAACLEDVRQRQAQSDDLVVEEGRAQLERMRHRGDVYLQQKVSRQVRLQVEQLQPGNAAACRLEANGARLPRVRPQLASQLE